MLPRSCDHVRAESGRPGRPRAGKRARPAGGGARRNNRPEPRAPRPAPRPRGRSPYLGEEGRPTRPDAASLHLRLGQPLTPAWLPLPAPGQRPACPHTHPELPRQAGVSGLAAEEAQARPEPRPPLPDRVAKASIPAATAAPPPPGTRVRRHVLR